jgi:hypothetical protein
VVVAEIGLEVDNASQVLFTHKHHVFVQLTETSFSALVLFACPSVRKQYQSFLTWIHCGNARVLLLRRVCPTRAELADTICARTVASCDDATRRAVSLTHHLTTPT